VPDTVQDIHVLVTVTDRRMVITVKDRHVLVTVTDRQFCFGFCIKRHAESKNHSQHVKAVENSKIFILCT